MQELMKKIVYAIAALALIFTGCAKELDNATKENFSKVRLRVKVADQIQTKVSADNDGSYHWQAGDIISVLNNDGDSYPFETESGGSEVDFSASSWSGDLGKYAMYPASSTHTALDDEVSFNLPESYIWSANATNMPMLGKITSSVATFHSVAGVLKLTIIGVPDDATELWFTATNKNITGNCTISDASQNGVFLSVADAGLTGKTVVFNFDGHRSDNMVFYIPLPVGTIDGFTIEFDDSENTSKTTTKNVAIARNSIVIAPVLNLTGASKTLIQETWGSYTGAVSSYTFSGTTTYDGTTTSLSYSVTSDDDVVSDATATGITSNNIFFVKSSASDFIMSGIKLEGCTKITVSYDISNGNVALYYKVDSGDYTQITESSTKQTNNSYTVNNISGTSLTLKFSKTGTSSNSRVDNITVVGTAGAANPVITMASDAVTISAGNLNANVTSVKLANPFDASDITFAIDPADDWISSVGIATGSTSTGDAVVRISAGSYNHDEVARVGHVYFRAAGAESKTITVTQNPSVVPSPATLNTIPDNANFSITWTGDGKAKSYVGYYSTSELVDPSTGISLDISNVGSDYTATPSETVTNGTEYHVYIKVNEVADASAEKYAASTIWAHTTVTPEAPTTISDVISGGAGSYTVYNVQCLAVIDSKNAIVGDATGRMLLYNAGGHGMTEGDIYTLEGSTTLFNSAIYEWSAPSKTRTGSASVNHGDALTLNNANCATLVEYFNGTRHSAVYVSGSGSKSGRNITVGSYTFYLGVDSDVADGEVNLTGYVYAYKDSNLNLMTTSLSSVGDPSVTACSWSRSGTTDDYTDGYTFAKAAEGKTGYYQDGSGTLRYIELYHSSTPMFSSTPKSITLTAKIGGGSGDTDLDTDVYACLVDNKGADIAGTQISITNHITTNTGDTYVKDFTPVESAYGVKIYHTKQTGYNVRYYSFSLKYVP